MVVYYLVRMCDDTKLLNRGRDCLLHIWANADHLLDRGNNWFCSNSVKLNEEKSHNMHSSLQFA